MITYLEFENKKSEVYKEARAIYYRLTEQGLFSKNGKYTEKNSKTFENFSTLVVEVFSEREEMQLNYQHDQGIGNIGIVYFPKNDPALIPPPVNDISDFL